MGLTHGLIGAVSASLALVALPAASAQAPTAAPPTGHHASHAVTSPAPTSSSAPVRDPARQAPLPRIKGTVGPGMTISVNRDEVVKGRYRIVVQDESTAHNWHISGPGNVNEETKISGTGKTVWRVRLRVGTYTIRCDVHPTTMRTTLRVTAD